MQADQKRLKWAAELVGADTSARVLPRPSPDRVAIAAAADRKGVGEAMTMKQRQLLLAYLGYYAGAIDGIWGPMTRKACAAFQQSLGNIAVDGYGGNETDKALREAVATDKFKDKEKEEALKNKENGTFWEEIEYFTREEFRCQCGGRYCSGFPAEPDETLVRLVNDLRKQAGRPAHRSSGLRCPTWNAIQNGTATSRHQYGKALDFYIEGVSGSRLLAMAQADSRTNYAYIIDGQYVHVDVA